jgi:uncharacterized protein (DUF697 family)
MGTQERAASDTKAVREVIGRASTEAAVLALEPVPLLDTAIFVPIQHRMVQAIARIRGHDLDAEAVRETFGLIRGHLVAPNVAIAAAKLVAFVPVLPDLIAGTIAWALTSTIGELADRYFSGGRAMPPAEVKACFDPLFRKQFGSAYRERRDELRAMFRSAQVRQAIGDARRAYQDGAIGTDELARRTTEILDAHAPQSP